MWVPKKVRGTRATLVDPWYSKTMKNKETKKVRIATCNSTGARYIVQQMTIGKTPVEDRVHCWGEVASARGLASKHEASKTFPRTAVTVTEVDKTFALLEGLWHQNLRAKQAAGRQVSLSRTGRTATVR